jgi:YfiH family protein
MKWREEDGARWLEARLPGARAAFTTRLGGASEGDFAELNVGLLTADSPDAVLENRRRVAALARRDPEGVLVGHQVHGAELAVRDAAPSPNPWTDGGLLAAEADGQLTANAGLTPLVQVADCLPVAVRGEGGVGMLHCGWRGLAAGIVERGVEALGGTAAAVGPGIGPCCFEVGEEVLGRFSGLGDGIAEGRMLDLPEVARRLLERAGIAEVEVSGLCTRCDPELFFSHRRDGDRAGRQAGLAWLETDG